MTAPQGRPICEPPASRAGRRRFNEPEWPPRDGPMARRAKAPRRARTSLDDLFGVEGPRMAKRKGGMKMFKTLDVARELFRLDIAVGVEDGETIRIIQGMFPGITSDKIKRAEDIKSDQVKMFVEDARARFARLKELVARRKNQVGPPNAKLERAFAELESMCGPAHLMPEIIFPRKPDKAKS